jgi:hypothetical protein
MLVGPQQDPAEVTTRRAWENDVEDEDVQQAARAIRPYLGELLESDTLAAALDERLAELLAGAAAGQSVKAGLLSVLSEYEATRTWTREFMKQKVPPQTYRGLRPPGDVLQSLNNVTSPAAQRWSCPFGDYDWYPSTKGERPPECPTHAAPLQQAI